VTDVEQPLELAGCAVTLWHYLPQGRPIVAADIAEPLTALHRAGLPPLPLPALTPVGAIRSGIAGSRILDDAARAVLVRRCDELAEAVTTLDYILKPALVHGDAQHRNTLWDEANHRPVLCDWDSVAIGQPEWDLATIEIHCRRFGHPAHEYDDFCRRYGFDVRQWSGYPLLRDLRELRMITTNARKAIPGSPQASEVHRRIARLDAAPGRQWVIL
jgi:aminoglycoside phosphotransferase (APT) family kinase protein